MKRIVLILTLGLMATFCASAQKFALVDMEYILKNIPSYEMANEQLNQLSQRWQKEVEAKGKEAENLYQTYLADKVFLTEEQVKKREEEIVAKEKETTELRYKYFGPEGELYKQRESLLSPIQDKLYEAVKAISTQKGISLVLDRASDSAILFASPSIDISDEVLSRLGVAN
jgi:outer membrane protein